MIDEPSFLKLLQNISFLLSLILIFDLLQFKVSKRKVFAKNLLIGILVGGIGVLIMLTPWVLSPGIVFDTRSVLLGVSGLFFGTIPTVIAMIITAALRLYQGGAGALMGLLVIFFSGSVGILWHHLRKEPLSKVKWWQLYLFGVLIHLIMLLLMFTLPRENINQALFILGPLVLMIYPVGTLLLGLILRNRLKRDEIKKKLVEATQRLNKTQQLSKTGGWEFDVLSQKMFWTDEVYRIHGYSPEDNPHGSTDLIDKSILCYQPQDRPKIMDAFQKCVSNGEAYDLEFPINSVTGEQKWVRTRGEAVYSNGKITNVIGNMIDITDRKLAEDEIREKEEFSRVLMDNLPIGIAVNTVFPIVEFTYMNDNFVQFYRTTKEALRGPDEFWEIVYEEPEFREKIKKQVLDDVASGDPDRMYWENIPITREGKETRYISAYNTLVPDSNLSISTVIDVTDQKLNEEEIKHDQEILKNLLSEAELSRQVLLSLIEDQRASEEQIRKLNAELEQRVKARTAQLEASNKELEAFAYSVSHDLRAPLRGIDGFSHILEKEHAHSLNEEGRRILGVVRKSAQKMNQLIIDLLALSRVRQSDLLYSEINMASMVQHVMKTLTTQPVMDKFEFIVKDLPVVNADSTLIRQVWVNLISNAIKYTSPKENGKIEIEGYEDDGCVTFVVRDNGVGYDSRYADKLFGLFQRLHSERDFEGSGIGLAIVERIIKRHNGRVWSKSEPGNGAEFYFSIPKVHSE
ncbi:MAG TPA: LytS/YhcK type 5TM receptor domain-containing protein [Anaerolineaceae bacterium]|nr:LytS/YhcK type 5TM receptor domain-containing protein [Anaerolineaceae bacterium]